MSTASREFNVALTELEKLTTFETVTMDNIDRHMNQLSLMLGMVDDYIQAISQEAPFYQDGFTQELGYQLDMASEYAERLVDELDRTVARRTGTADEDSDK